MAGPILHDYIEAMHTSQKAAWVEKYEGSIKDIKQVRGGQTLNEYKDKRIKDASGFNDISVGDTTLGAKLALPAAAAAKAHFDEALKLTDPTNNAIAAFNARFSHLTQLVASEPNKWKHNTVGSYILEQKGEAVAAINAQHLAETNALKEKFDNPASKAELLQGLGYDETQLNNLKTQMLGKLDKSQKEELAKAEKTLTAISNGHFYAMKIAFERIGYIADRYERSKKMKQQVDQLREVAPGVGASNEGIIGSDKFKHINVKDLKTDETINGNTIYVQEDGTCSVKLNRLFLTERKAYGDMASLAQRLKAEGHTTITTDIQCKDPKKAEELGRKAYEAAIRAGFDPKKITIVVNGETKLQFNNKGAVEKNELFKTDPLRFNKAQKLGAQIAKTMDDKVRKTPTQLAALKAAVQTLQNQGQEQGLVQNQNQEAGQGPGEDQHQDQDEDQENIIHHQNPV
ncbi:MAG: hypothetical protein WC785_02655 [Tatlockia sp.]|jgi:hypothetical protein